MPSGCPVTKQVGADAHRHLLRVLWIGGFDLPARPRHHRLKGVARLRRRQRLLAGGVRRLVARGGVPEVSAALGCRRDPYLDVAVIVELCSRAREDLRPVNGLSRHVSTS